ncbi:MAG TPA: hypothetical protein VMT82_08570 [candidate division Zixibacteria bacterium]|nr:hypothetical protein [candidate division Zixibacteria bacterium]
MVSVVAFSTVYAEAQVPRSTHGKEPGHEQSLRKQRSYLGDSILLLRTLFPNVSPHSHLVIDQFDEWDSFRINQFRVRICDGARPDAVRMIRNPLVDEGCPNVEVNAQIYVSRGHGRVIPEIRLYWPETFKREESLRDKVKDHPPQTHAELVQVLKAAGVRYGPEEKSEFLRQAPLQALKDAYGNFQVRAVIFVPKQPSDVPEVPPTWCVIGTSDNIELHFFFSAFDGRIDSVETSEISRVGWQE